MSHPSPRPVALIAGASRGLGLLISNELLRHGYRVVITSRSQESLDDAAQWLGRNGAAPEDVIPLVMDVSNHEQVTEVVQHVEQEVAPIDVAVHVAGIIEVGPAENTTRAHLERAINTMTWGPINLSEAVLPYMRERQHGRFGVIASIGGLLSAPHLLAYSTAKFAAVGYTEGLAASLQGSGVSATVIAPGLMRTGSHTAAAFFGNRQHEYNWFAAAASLPGLSMDAEHAAQRIVAGILAGKPYVILTPAAKVGARVHGVAPGLTTRVLGLSNRFLPAPIEGAVDPVPGSEFAPNAGRAVQLLSTLGERARRRHREP